MMPRTRQSAQIPLRGFARSELLAVAAAILVMATAVWIQSGPTAALRGLKL